MTDKCLLIENNRHTLILLSVKAVRTAETVPSPPATIILAEEGIHFVEAKPFLVNRIICIGFKKHLNKDKTSSPVPPPDFGLPLIWNHLKGFPQLFYTYNAKYQCIVL